MVLLQPLHWRCIECVIYHERDLRKNNTHIYVARTSNNEGLWHVISIVACCHSVKLCALAAQAFRSQQNGAVTRMWRSCQVQLSQLKNVWLVRFVVKRRDVVATSPLALRWMCDSPWMGCVWRTTPMYMWHEQAIIEWSWHVLSIVACCHSVKLCILIARAFQLQQCNAEKELFSLQLVYFVRHWNFVE